MRKQIVAQLQRRGIRARESGISNEIKACCPFCQLRGKMTPDLSYALGVNIKSQKGHCFRCGWRSRDNALKQLKIFVDAGEKEKTLSKPKIQPPEDFEPLDQSSQDEWMQLAYAYVFDRGLSKEQIERYQIGLCLMGKFRGRIVFPVFHMQELLGFTGRTLVPGREPKWLHSTGLQAPFSARWGRKEEIVLVEGVFDALKVERFLGHHVDVIALLGTHLSEEREKWIKRYPIITLWFDPDRAGASAAIETAERLLDMGKEVLITMSGSDPADLNQEGIEGAFRQRRSWSRDEGLQL